MDYAIITKKEYHIHHSREINYGKISLYFYLVMKNSISNCLFPI